MALLLCLAASALLTGNLLAAQETSVEAEKAVLLSCVLPYSVDECQWSWKAINETNTLSMTVKKFRAFGNQTRDCSVHFSSVRLEQEGVWTCGSRLTGQRMFTPSAQITLLVYQPVTFVEVSTTVAAKLDKPIALICKTVEQEVECQWSWQTGLLVNGTSVVVEQFKSDGGDCSIHLESALIAQEGLCTCRARNVGDRQFTSARATHVTVSTELEFVQLSQDIQVNVGEPVWLRCVVSLPVELCHWSWLPLDNPEAEPLIMKDFSPIDEQKRDCSVRIASVLEEQRGLWACGVRHKEVSQFTVAPPAKLTLLPPVKIHFVETPRDVRVAIGQPVTLRCVAASSLADCLWMWHPLNEPEKPGLLVKQFSAFGNHSRDCSAHFKNVMAPQEGHWGCTVRGGPSEALLEAKSPLAKLTTYAYIPVEFTEISKDIQVPLGRPLFLRCVVSIPVEECQWSWKALNNTNETESTVRTFHAYGNNSQDCSLRIKSASEENEGIWNCAAYKNDENTMTQAPPTRVVLLKPGIVRLRNITEKS